MSGLGRFKDHVAIVTGAGGGIGEATAQRLSSEGAAVVIADRDAGLADTAAKKIADAGGKALALVLDVTRDEEVERACERTMAEFGRLDVMVCSAGTLASATPAVDYSVSEWDRVLSVNMTGTMLCARSAARRMITAGSGSIVTVSSVNALRAAAGAIAYNASKAAVISITQTLAVELGKSGVRVNTVAPAQIDTAMTAVYSKDPEARRMRERGIPLGRFGRPEEVAAAIAFLASSDASFVNGHTLLVDGGRLIQQF